MWGEGELQYGYPFAVDLYIDGYEGPSVFKKFLRRQSGWLKAVRVRLETPLHTWGETLFACMTDSGTVFNSFPASFLTAMPSSLPMEVEHVPPEDELDERIDELYWDFLGRCDRHCLRMLDQAHAEADLVVRQHEAELAKLNRQIDGKLKLLSRALRDPLRRDQWPDLETKKARLLRMADQLPALFQERMRKARRGVDDVEALALSSMGYEGETEELFTAYFRVQDRNESPRTLLRWQRSPRTHQVPWEDERKQLVKELTQNISFEPNIGVREPLFLTPKDDGAGSKLQKRQHLRDGISATDADEWFQDVGLDDGEEGLADEAPDASAEDGTKTEHQPGPDDADTPFDEDAFRRILEADAQRELDAVRVTKNGERGAEVSSNSEETAFQHRLAIDAAKELANAAIHLPNPSIEGPFSLVLEEDRRTAQDVKGFCERLGRQPGALEGGWMCNGGHGFSRSRRRPPEAVEIVALIIAFVGDMMKLRDQITV